MDRLVLLSCMTITSFTDKNVENLAPNKTYEISPRAYLSAYVLKQTGKSVKRDNC